MGYKTKAQLMHELAVLTAQAKQARERFIEDIQSQTGWNRQAAEDLAKQLMAEERRSMLN